MKKLSSTDNCLVLSFIVHVYAVCDVNYYWEIVANCLMSQDVVQIHFINWFFLDNSLTIV